MQKLTIGHNGAGAGAGWHLDKVAVQNMRRCVSEQVCSSVAIPIT